MNSLGYSKKHEVDFLICRELDFGTLSFCADKVIFKFEFKKDLVFSFDVASQIFQACNEVCENKKYFLITVMKTKLLPTKDVYDFYSAPGRAEFILKEAFILNSSTLKLAANFYFKIKKPKVKGKVFDFETEAIDWLLESSDNDK
jgi:hypothetical protein